MTLRLAACAALFSMSMAGGADSRPGEASLPFLFGGDVSMAPNLEAQGVVYKEDGRPKDIFAIFRDRGATCIRLRLFVHPNGRGGVVNDTASTISLAKRVKAAGLLFSLDLHYSDTWADPGHQITPAAWRGLSFPQLVDKTRSYTADTLRAFRAADVTPDIVQIGNEITYGLLWPQGQLHPHSADEAAQFDRVAALLKADVEGIHLAMAGEPSPRIMIHIDGADATGIVAWFFDHLVERQVPFDMIGLSYYPSSGGGLDHVRETFALAARRYGKPIVIAETAYPYADGPVWQGQRKSFAWPLSPAGQKQYLLDLLHLVKATPNGLGAGILYWYPESVVPAHARDKVWNAGEAALFDRNGNALPAFDVFRDGGNG